MRDRRLLIDALILGVVAALAVVSFSWMLHVAQSALLGGIAGYQPPGLPSEGASAAEAIGRHGLWLLPLALVVGALLSGLLVYTLAPEAEGHGTDAVVRSFHQGRGALSAAVPFVKLVASALTIGSGGSAGREGPLALVGAGFGSIYAKWRKRSDDEARILLLTGMAAGIGAVFRSPVGAAFFAVEVVYGGMEFESPALLFAMLSAIVSYALSGTVLGWQPLFHIPRSLMEPSVTQYPWYVLLGVTGGVVAAAFPPVFYGARDAFRRLPILPHLRPAVGAAAVGLMALALPQVLGGGYGWMQRAIDGNLDPILIATLLVAKPIATSLTVTSGGSGGVFAPTLFTGAMLGGGLAGLFHQPPAPFVIVGMGAVFAGAARVPFATLMMVMEMTGGYTLLIPAAATVSISYLVQRRLTRHFKYPSLYEAQVATPSDSPAHHVAHLRIALQILRQHRQALPADVGRMDLVTLLQSGIPIDLPDGRRLIVGLVTEGSALVGTAPDTGRRLGHASEVIGVMRGDRMMAAAPTQPFAAGDRLILVLAAEDSPQLEPQLSVGWTQKGS